MSLPRKSATDIEKENLISKALETVEGREALARVMVEPIRARLKYPSILTVDREYEPNSYAVSWAD